MKKETYKMAIADNKKTYGVPNTPPVQEEFISKAKDWTEEQLIKGAKSVKDTLPVQRDSTETRPTGDTPPVCQHELCGCEADEWGFEHKTCAHGVCQPLSTDTSWPFEQQVGFKLIDILTNGNYIGGFGAVEIADKLEPEVKKLLDTLLSQRKQEQERLQRLVEDDDFIVEPYKSRVVELITGKNK